MSEVIFNCYDWLPTYGESVIRFDFNGANTTIEIYYENESQSGQVIFYKRILSFSATRYFIYNPLPGHDIILNSLSNKNVSKQASGALVSIFPSEYLNDCKSLYESMYGRVLNSMKHLYIQFLSENCAFHVLADSIELSKPEVVDSLPD